MKKTILFVALGIITVCCIIYGTSKHLGFGNPFTAHERDYDHDWDYDDGEKRERNGKHEINQILESFSEIKIKSNIMSLVIEEGPEFKIEGSFSKDSLRPLTSVKNGVLQISQHSPQHGFSTGSQHCKVVLTIPSGTNLSSVDINASVGDIRIRDLNADDIEISLNVGEIDVRKVQFNTIDCENNVGEISIDPLADLSEYSMSLSTDVGEVRVDGDSYRRSYNCKAADSSKKIKADTNVGEINIR